ncbi:alpha-galactosidase/6-phospho-beta-glucosidase family protein [Rhizobium sp. BK049]|nr:alpha-galactosidase/6-phospho-beta-glucosidase family protein [Rhizobium sp. BK049]
MSMLSGAAGINHMAFYLKFEHRQADGSYRNLYLARLS